VGLFFYFMRNLNPEFLAKGITHLRIIWIILLVLLLVSFAGNVIAFPKSFALQKSHYYVFAFRIVTLGLLLIATYRKTQRWWFLTIAVVSIKAFSLLKFYIFYPYYVYSGLYYGEYVDIFFRLKFPSLVLLLFETNLLNGAFFLSVYGYCLYLGEALVQVTGNKPNAFRLPAPTPSGSATP
jgi:hypothetical protein